MKEFLMIFRRDYKTKHAQPSPETVQAHLQHWQEWFDRLAAEDRLARPPQRWDGQGKVIRQGNSVTDGPYAEIKESIGGVTIIKAGSYEEAVQIAQGCPIFELGGTVEIRMGL